MHHSRYRIATYKQLKKETISADLRPAEEVITVANARDAGVKIH